jgi:hypothetical protein
MDWDSSPKQNEKNFSEAPLAMLQEIFHSSTLEKQSRMRDNMLHDQMD